MKPYHSEGGIDIYHGNCMDVLPCLPKVDAVVTDPNYGDTSLEWDKMLRGWMDKIEPLTSTVWCFGSFRMFMEMARNGESSRWKLAQEIIWEKQNGSSFHADRFKRVHEIAVQWYQGEWSEVYKSPVKEKALEGKARNPRKAANAHGRYRRPLLRQRTRR